MDEMDQVQANKALVAKLIADKQAETASKMADTVLQGNKALIPVEIDYIADSGTHFVGTIIMRRPSPMDYTKIGAFKSNLFRTLGILPIVDPRTGLESMAHVDSSVRYLMTALSSFRVLLADCPEWFKNYENSYDSDLVVHAYDRFEDELNSFRRPTPGPTSGSGEGSADTAAMAPEEDVRGGATGPEGRDIAAE